MVKKSKFLIVIFMILALSSTAFAGDKRIGPNVSSGQRMALVIGNGAYQFATRLDDPVNDARGMTRTLRQLGFEVTKKEDLRYQEMSEVITEFGERLIRTGAPVGLFYFSGHGAQSAGENYLIPVEADIRHEKQLRYKAVSAGMVLAEMENARNRLNILILDACRNTPKFSGGTKSITKAGLASMKAPVGTLIAYSTSPGEVAREGPGKYSLYTANLIQSLKIPGLEIEDVFKRVRRRMIRFTDGLQIPWESSCLTGDFYFAGGSAVIEEPAPAPAPRTGGLRVKTTPSGATVWIDGRNRGRSPLNLENLNPGTVRIRASMSGYSDEEQSADIQKGIITQVNLYLDRLVTTTTVRPEPEPTVMQGRVRLKKQPRTLSDDDVRAMMKEHNFFCKKYSWSEKWYNESGDFENDFVKSRDGKTVTDRVTGLMWQQSGSDNTMVYKKAQPYIDKLNRQRFAGYSDWRLPTLEELMSLMEREEVNGRYIDPVFDGKQGWCWSADRSSGRAWIAYFHLGLASRLSLGLGHYVRGVRP